MPDEEVKAALLAAYANGSWGKYDGPNSAILRDTLVQLVGQPFVELCSSGTIAIELALRGLRIEPGDEVILAAYDFSGNFRAVEAVGGRPVLVDLAPSSWRMDLECLTEAIGPKTKVVIASHLHGDLLPMPTLCGIARAQNVAVIEDCCQVPGATVAGQPAGSWGDISVFSFGGSKLLTAGRGGAAMTSCNELHQRMRIANERGNLAYPLSELQAAVLPPQLAKLGERNATRLANVRRLLQQVALIGLEPVQLVSDHTYSAAFYKLPFFLPDRSGAGPEIPREDWIAHFQAAGLAIDAGFRGFAKRSSSRCRQVGELTNARRAARSTLVLHHPVLLQSAATIDEVGAILARVCHALEAGDA
jgi:dTDP-4-amino-4,6-dideoxygalactose transaminase